MKQFVVLKIIWWQMLPCDVMWGVGGPAKKKQNTHTHQSITVVLKGGCGLLHLPADSPVLIQSGFAILAIAKISAARKRQPEMIVSLSIFPADKTVNDVEGMCWSWSKKATPSAERHRVAVISLTSPPFNGSLLLRFGCAFCSNVAPSRQANKSLQLQKAQIRRTKASHFKCSL